MKNNALKRLAVTLYAFVVIALAGVLIWASVEAAKDAAARRGKTAVERGEGKNREAPETAAGESGADDEGESGYAVFVEGKFAAEYVSFAEAEAFAALRVYAEIFAKGRSKCLWSNYPYFVVYLNDSHEGDFTEFFTFAEAAAYAAENASAYVYLRKNWGLVWDNAAPLAETSRLEAAQIFQMPELPRGCEVTSLAMLLNFFGVDADKLELAEMIRKNEAEYRVIDGIIHYGDPNDGFVGSMYSLAEAGLGVYHAPAYDLLAEFMPDSAMDLTGCAFEDILRVLEKGSPVWVIINTAYRVLPESAFRRWRTPNGDIDVTYNEHSVLVTGFDEKYIYFNDPLAKAGKAPRAEFAAAWEQMGSQALACAP